MALGPRLRSMTFPEPAGHCWGVWWGQVCHALWLDSGRVSGPEETSEAAAFWGVEGALAR